MLDQADTARARTARNGPRLDFQEHLADLEAAGLIERIDAPVNKDTELHPLVRWQFVGGVPEEKRRAFVFTNVTDAKGRKYDIPVVVGALSASPEIYAIGMGRKVDDLGDAWMPGGRHHRQGSQSAGRAQCASGAGIDAGLRLRALSDRDALHHP